MRLRLSFRAAETVSWRDEIWSRLAEPWDLLVVGGGITGAGIFREAVRAGLRTLLVERRDFAWGTSSRSSKLVHGGLRYLKEARLGLVHDSVRERARLLEEAPGLVEPLDFLLATYSGDSPGPLTYGVGLALYDLLAFQWNHEQLEAVEMMQRAPALEPEGLLGGFHYGDAKTDDARLVLRLLREGVAAGGTVLNYAGVDELLKRERIVAGANVLDGAAPRHTAVRARAVVNATGVWADRLRGEVGAPARMRPLRGSHLVFEASRFPAAEAVSVLHPVDRRPLFVIPWEGVTLWGTTDIDHTLGLEEEPVISPEEIAYLMEGLNTRFPSLDLKASDAIASFTGIRPVVGTGRAKPSEESRDHVIWEENGLVTVTGGKLTTFRLVACQALAALRHRLPGMNRPALEMRAFDALPGELPGIDRLPEPTRRRLLGRYGAEIGSLLAVAREGELDPVPGTPISWAEVRWAARSEWIVHLEDLLLRRVRLGLVAPEGGRELLPRIRRICKGELDWSDSRWKEEEDRYLELWRRCYGPPP